MDTTFDSYKTRDKVFAYIQKHVALNGYSPSVREIAAAVGLSSPASAKFHLRKLQEAGLITMKEGKSRTIKIVPHAGPATNLDVLADMVNKAKTSSSDMVALAERLAEMQRGIIWSTSQWFDYLQREAKPSPKRI